MINLNIALRMTEDMKMKKGGKQATSYSILTPPHLIYIISYDLQSNVIMAFYRVFYLCNSKLK